MPAWPVSFAMGVLGKDILLRGLAGFGVGGWVEVRCSVLFARMMVVEMVP
jgi:hypothetical protein